MSKIDELKDSIKLVLDRVDDTEVIKQLGTITNIVADIETETNTMLNQHKELKDMYKKAIMSAGMVKQQPVEDVVQTKTIDFDTMLSEFMKNN